MSHRLLFTAEARSDVADALRWLRGQSPQAAGRFEEALNHTLTGVAEAPERYAVVHREVRRALLKHFPYSVFCVVQSDAVVILAVLHQARHPSVWKRRRPSEGGEREVES